MAAKDTKSGMATDERHVYGPRPLGALMPRLTRPAFRRRAPATAQVLADWAAIVGPAIAAVTTPRRLSAGTLTIACAGPIAMELQYLAPELIGRINAHLGHQTVASLRFVQTAPIPAPLQPTQPAHVDTSAADAAVAALPEGELRDALAALGRAVLVRQGGPRRKGAAQRAPRAPGPG
jgi:hypothetical protein